MVQVSLWNYIWNAYREPSLILNYWPNYYFGGDGYLFCFFHLHIEPSIRAVAHMQPIEATA